MKKKLLLLHLLTAAFFATAQNVGIGTTTPVQKLHVEGTTYLNGNVGIGTTNPNAPLGFPATLGKKITLYPGSTGDAGLAVQGNLLQIYADHPNADIAFGYDQGGVFTERMRIKGNGNAGIGTLTPTSKLNLNGQVTIDQKNFGGFGGLLIKGGTSAANYPNITFSILNNAIPQTDVIAGYIGGNINSDVAGSESMDLVFSTSQTGFSGLTEKFRIKDNGNVGIGTTAPGFPLNFANTLGDKISLYGNTGNHYGFGIQGGTLQIYAGVATDDIAFGTGSSSAFTEAMRIKGNGNVGIGTTNPNAPLGFPAVLGKKITLYPGGTGDVGLAVQGNLLQIYADNPSADIAFGYDQGGVFTERMRIKGDGNVGIGLTNPSATLEVVRGTGVNGTAVFRGTTNMSHFNYGTDEDTYIRAGKNNRYVILNDIPGGKVGIGTTAPATTLEVNGYTKLGNDAPSIKVKKLTGTTAPTQGGSVFVSTGVPLSKILAVSIMVSGIEPNVAGIFSNYYWQLVSSGEIYVTNVSGDSAFILSDPIIILLTYEE